jgi:tyrosyl-tRNA synthetase
MAFVKKGAPQYDLAREYVRIYHGEQAAEHAEEHFNTVFQKRSIPEDIEKLHLSIDCLEEGSIQI